METTASACELVQPPSGGHAARTVALGASEPAVRVLASTAAERTLVARLQYTSVQRGTGALAVRSEGDRIVSWFPYEVRGIRTGLHEGVILGREDDFPFDWLESVVQDTGATLFKLTRVAPSLAAQDDAPAQRTRHWTTIRSAKRVREVLPLAPTYDLMLADLGRHTRRNIRAARKLAGAERFEFEVSTGSRLMSEPARAELARRTRPHGTRGSLGARLEAHADRTGRSFRTMMRGVDGGVISYACGYFGDPSTAYLLYQLNDPAANAIGPSLLHRAFLIEWLIQLGCSEFVFVHGCSGILRHACVRQHLEEVLLVRRSAPGYLNAGLIGLCKPNTSLGRLARLALASEVRDR